MLTITPGPDAPSLNDPANFNADALALFTWLVENWGGSGGHKIPTEDASGDVPLSGGLYLGGNGAANLLTDYEEGTWSPTVQGADVAGAGVYSAQLGNYIKIGNLVTLSFSYNMTSHTGSGQWELAGIPFVPGGQAGMAYQGAVMLHGYDTTAARTSFTLYTSEGLDHIRLYGTGDNLPWEHQPLDSGHVAIGTISYFTS